MTEKNHIHEDENENCNVNRGYDTELSEFEAGVVCVCNDHEGDHIILNDKFKLKLIEHDHEQSYIKFVTPNSHSISGTKRWPMNPIVLEYVPGHELTHIDYQDCDSSPHERAKHWISEGVELIENDPQKHVINIYRMKKNVRGDRANYDLALIYIIPEEDINSDHGGVAHAEHNNDPD